MLVAPRISNRLPTYCLKCFCIYRLKCSKYGTGWDGWKYLNSPLLKIMIICVYRLVCTVPYVWCPMRKTLYLCLSLFPEVKPVSVKSSPLTHFLVPISATTTMASWEVNRHHVNAWKYFWNIYCHTENTFKILLVTLKIRLKHICENPHSVLLVNILLNRIWN